MIECVIDVQNVQAKVRRGEIEKLLPVDRRLNCERQDPVMDKMVVDGPPAPVLRVDG